VRKYCRPHNTKNKKGCPWRVSSGRGSYLSILLISGFKFKQYIVSKGVIQSRGNSALVAATIAAVAHSAFEQ
jgi:hypothetical protein